MNKPIGRYAYRADGISDATYKKRKAEGFHWCLRHKEWETDVAARACRITYAKKYHSEHRDEHITKMRENYWKNPEKYRAIATKSWHGLGQAEKSSRLRRWKLTRKYGVTLEWYDETLKQQNGGCAICGKHIPTGKYKKYMHIDHNHSNGKARGILCNGCNTGIAWLEKSDWMTRALSYLQQHAV